MSDLQQVSAGCRIKSGMTIGFSRSLSALVALMLVMVALFAAMIFAGCKADAGNGVAREDVDTAGVAMVGVDMAGIGSAPDASAVLVTDSAGRRVSVVREPARVAALTSSFADLWALAGGDLAAVCDDFARERSELAASFPLAVSLGGLLEPNMELLFELDPELVILSPELPSHKALAPLLDDANIPYYYAKIDSFEDYLKVFSDFTALTGRADLYEANGRAQQAMIDTLLADIPADAHPSVLFLRVSTTKIEAIARDHIVCGIVEKAGGKNIAFSEDSVLRELSIEAVVEADPDFIFVVFQGTDAAKSEAILASNFTDSPLWGDLTAVKAGRFVILPKDLFHLKPNARWTEAYEVLLRILYPDAYA